MMRRALGTLGRAILPGRRSPRRTRYDTLHEVFEREVTRKRRILEIGTYNGTTGAALLTIARRSEPRETIHYYGFDLFEDLDEQTLAREASKKPTRSLDDVRCFIAAETGIAEAQVHLYRGFTQHTLWASLPHLPPMGFIFIDGGHSYETVDSDWRACRQLMTRDTVVVFDDYYQFDHGPRRVIDALDPSIYAVAPLEPVEVFADPFGISPDGTLAVRLVKVTLR